MVTEVNPTFTAVSKENPYNASINDAPPVPF